MSSELSKKKCVPCEGKIPAMTLEEENKYIKEVPEWNLIKEGIHRIIREFKFKDFKESMKFVNSVAKIAEKEGHHPDIYIFYNKVRIELHTHAVNGLFMNDFILASKIDKIV